MSGRYDVKSGCAFLFADVLGRNCLVDLFAGAVLLRFPGAASTISVTLSHGDCLSWRKTFSGMGGCMSIWRVVGDCIATSILVCGLGCSDAGDRENTGGDLVTSRLTEADEVIGVILLVVIDAVVRPTASVGMKILENAGKKVKQSSWLSVPSMYLCVSAVSWVSEKFLGLFLVGTLDVGGGSKYSFSLS